MKVPKKLHDVLNEVVCTTEESSHAVDGMMDSAEHAGHMLRKHAEKLMEFADELYEWSQQQKKEEEKP